MSANNKEKRVDDALKALVATFLADASDLAPTEDDLQRQQDEVFLTLRGPLRRGMWTFQDNSYDVSTIIRRQLAQTGRSSDAAMRFGNIYSRLMALPIINNKAGILSLLHQLSPGDLDDENGDGGDGFVNDLPMHPFRRSSVNDGGRRSPRKQQEQQEQRQQRQQQQQNSKAYDDYQQDQRHHPRNQTPLDKPRTGLAEATLARINRQSTDISSPKNPREAQSRSSATASRQSRAAENASHSPFKAPGGDPSSGGVEQPSGLPLEPIDRSPTEASLLRDLPFVLQGLSTSNLVFSGEGEDLSRLTLPAELPLPLVSILHTLAEPSLLYRQLASFARASQKGLVLQSLQAAVETQLRAYLGLISTLEVEIRRCLAHLGDSDANNVGRATAPPDGTDGDDGRPRTAASRALAVSRVGVTLKRCVVWTHDATLGLRLLVSIVTQAESGCLKGGSLISLVHRLADANGDPFVSGFAERILGYLTRPFYDMLRQWIYDGELRDPYGEFFVYEVDPDNDGNGRERDSSHPKRLLASSVWDNKYKMNAELVPTIVDEEFARKVFLIGKSLNFIRYSCGDSEWVEQYSKEHSRELAYGDVVALGSSIDIAYKTTMAHLIHLLDAKFGLFSHLEALKRYLLLGQGDFIVLLIESLASNLDKPAGTQYRHTLTAQLDHAIRGSNAQFDNPEILRRLDARLLEMTHGEIGWDVFTLEYKVDAPCDVVVTSWASRQYLSVFNLLWRIKRIEFALSGTWRRVTTGARTVLAQVGGRGGSRRKQTRPSSPSSASSSSHAADLASDWKAARCTLSAMVHFVTQLQYFVMVEVVEASWNKLQEDIRKDGVTLDDMTEAHTRYLRTITHRALLGGAKHSVTGDRDDAFPAQLHRLLKAILAYAEAIDGLYAYSVAEYTKQQQEAAAKATADAVKRRPQEGWPSEEDDLDSPLPGELHSSRSAPGAWDAGNVVDGGPRTAFGVTDEDTMLPALRKRMMELSSEFKTRLETLLGDLLMQPDQELRFLSVAMNYNDVYKPVRRKRRREKDKDKDREREKEGSSEKSREKAEGRSQ